MSDMIEYTIKRLFTGIFVIFAVTALLFAIMQLMPGDAIQLIANPRVSPERIEELREAWGLNKPAYVQYFYWLSHVLKGDLGTSISTGQQVSVLIKARFPYTMLLTGLSLILQYIIAVPLGLITASNKNTRADGIMVGLTIILWSMPPFWLGILLMLVFGIWLKLLYFRV